MALTRVGFIGAGEIFELHARGVQDTEDAAISAIWNRTRERAEQRARAFDVPRVCDTVDELLALPDLDVVYVITNMETHVDYAIAALEAGKHVLVEKPVAGNLADIERLQAAATASGKCCAPVHNYIYEPSLIRTRSMIEQQQLGQLCSIYMLYNIHHDERVCARYPGVIRQILTHHAYVSLYLAGAAPRTVSCLKATINDDSVPQENLAHASLQFESGAIAHLCASFAADDNSSDPWTCLVKVIGTEGSTRFSYRDWVENQAWGPHAHTFSCYPFSIRNVGKHFIERVVRRGEPPLSSIADAATSQRIIEACERSVTEGVHVQLDG
ncbi:MAG: Gfo/Idh/MocA family oxidoreductase [Planctomycetota bacterium]